MKKKLILFLLTLGVLFSVVGCAKPADVASQNLSVAADNFQITRRIVFYNGITGDYILSVEGRCSIKADRMDKQLELTCKISPTAYKKHFLGLSDNVTYFCEQIESAEVDAYNYKVIFKPQSIIPDVQLSKK